MCTHARKQAKSESARETLALPMRVGRGEATGEEEETHRRKVMTVRSASCTPSRKVFASSCWNLPAYLRMNMPTCASRLRHGSKRRDERDDDDDDECERAKTEKADVEAPGRAFATRDTTPPRAALACTGTARNAATDARRPTPDARVRPPHGRRSRVRGQFPDIGARPRGVRHRWPAAPEPPASPAPLGSQPPLRNALGGGVRTHGDMARAPVGAANGYAIAASPK